jgi:Flp pilus assembly protein TadG
MIGEGMGQKRMVEKPPVGTPRRLGWQRGAAALEMAVVAPILLLLVFGIMESGWFFAQQVELNNAAREGGRLAVVDYGTAAEIASETCARASLSGANATVTVTRSTTLDPEVGDPPGTPESITVTMANNYQSLTGFLDFFDGLEMTSTVEMRTERPLETLVTDGGGSCP